jgi:MFS family permease
METAEAIASRVGLRVVQDHGLIDMAYGQRAGYIRDELIRTCNVDRAPGVEPADQGTAGWNGLVHVMGDWRVTLVPEAFNRRSGRSVTRRHRNQPENPMPPPAPGPTDPPGDAPWLTTGVVSVGTASLFSDSSHEMVTSLLPSFLTATLGAGPAALGAIDGVADALTGVCKLAGGPLANDPARRGRLAAGGYLGTAVATAAIGLTVAVWQVAVLRAFAWVSRGLRSPARDMLLTDLSSRDTYGRAFGVERAGDNAGAIIGPLLAAALVTVIGIREAMLLSIIPGVLAAVAITIAARQVRRTLSESAGRRTLTLNLGELRRAGLARTLTPVALFELGNVATTLLILRASDLLQTGGRDVTAATSLAIVLYAAHNGAASLAAIGGGHLADRFTARHVFTAGAVAYVVGYAVFAVGWSGWPVLLVAFLLCGIGIGFAETAESTVIAKGLPDRLRANGFGVLGLTQAFGDLGATLVAGLLWSLVSPTVAFTYAAVWMLGSVVASGLLTDRASTAG